MPLLSQFLFLVLGTTLVAVSRTWASLALATWLGLALMLHFVRTSPPVPGILWTFGCVYLVSATANRSTIPVSGAVYLAIVFAIAVSTTIPFIVDRLFASRFPGVASTLLFPMAMVAVELLVTRYSPQGSWGSTGYTQFANLPLMQLVSVTGLSGITFLVAWFASTLNWAWDRSFVWDTVRPGVLLYIVVITIVMVAGTLRLASAANDAPTVRVAVLSYPKELFVPGEVTRIQEGRLSDAERPVLGVKVAQLQDWFLDGTRREARAGAKLIAWPETNLLVFKEDEAAFIERARRVAREERVYLMMGMAAVRNGAPRPTENKAVLVNANGDVEFSYLKSKAVPGWEASIMVRGNEPPPVRATTLGRIGTAICFEGDFPNDMREIGRERADLMIVPSNDWLAIKQLHFRMAAVRAIENGAPLLRPTSSGLSGVVDAYGRVLALTDHFSPGARVLVAQVPIGHVGTIYARTGDFFGWLCLAGVVVAIVVAIA